MSLKIGINGFGRIGRCVLRAALKNHSKNDIEIVHINDLTNTATLAHLLKYDSVHGTLENKIIGTDGGLNIDGKNITVSAMKDPAQIPWGKSNVDMVLECTGIFTKKADAELHLKNGPKNVIISAPATDEDLTVVFGVNHTKINPAQHHVISNASCTTNCLAPVAKILHDALGIKRGFMTTVHSYTNDQNILDLPHKDLRRARAAGLSMIPTSTGAAKAIGLVIPELKGKLNGGSIRVPTPNVSLVDVTFEVGKATTVDEVNQLLKNASEGAMKGILGYCDEPLVSKDYNGDPRSSIVDSLSTMVLDGTLVKVLAWYDNETGFSHRMLDVAKLYAR